MIEACSIRDLDADLRSKNLSSLFMYSSPLIKAVSDCEDDSAEGAALNQITQSISRFGQREGLSHYRFDRAGLAMSSIRMTFLA
jgi:hypothetical protein